MVSLVLPRRVANIEIGEEVPSRYLLLAVIAMSLVFGALLAFPQDDWTSLALLRWGQPFRESDPYFEYDLGFWTYWLPFETSLHVWALIALLAATTVVVFLYALTPSLRWERGTLHVSGYVRRHLSLLGALLIFLLAWSYRLDGLGLLINGTGVGGAFTSADWKVGVPANFVLAFTTGAAAVLVGWATWTGQMRIAFVAVTAVLALSLGLRQFLPPLAQRLADPIDPEARESGYLATRASYTRRAYAVDRIIVADTTGARIALPSVRESVAALSQWDAAAIKRAVERRRQGIVSGTIGWASDSSRLVAVAAQRPSGPDAVDPFTPWTVTRVRAWSADERGGLTGLSGGGVEEGGAIPAVLVADSAAGPLVVSDREGDVDAPEISRWPSRVAHAWDQQNLRLMFTDLDVREPRMMLHRGVHDRLRMVAPFFWQSGHVSPVAWRDSLYWAVHLYSASAYYPLSEHTRLGGDDVTYIRHAATALVHGHTGHVTMVADSVLDPIAATWVRRFPSLFVSWSSLPAGVVASIPPAIESGVAQAAAFARVGMRAEPAPPAHLPATFGGDTTFGGAWRPLHLAPPDGRLALDDTSARRRRSRARADRGGRRIAAGDVLVSARGSRRALAGGAGATPSCARDRANATRRHASSRPRPRRADSWRRCGLHPDDVRLAERRSADGGARGGPRRGIDARFGGVRHVAGRSGGGTHRAVGFRRAAHASRLSQAGQRPVYRHARRVARWRLARLWKGIR